MTALMSATGTPVHRASTAPTSTNAPEVEELGPSNAIRIGAAVLATAAGAGIGTLLTRRGDLGWKFGAGMGAMLGASAGAIGSSATWERGRAGVGQVSGSYHWQEKVGEESYRTTCTETITDSQGTHTHTFPCTKTRGIYEDRWSSATEDLSIRQRVARGPLDDVVAAVAARKEGTFAVIRHDGAYQAHKVGDGIIDFPERYSLDHPGSVAVITRDGASSEVASVGPDVTAAEHRALDAIERDRPTR